MCCAQQQSKAQQAQRGAAQLLTEPEAAVADEVGDLHLGVGTHSHILQLPALRVARKAVQASLSKAAYPIWRCCYNSAVAAAADRC